MYERSLDPTLKWIREQVRQEARRSGSEHARAEGRVQLRRDDRDACRSSTASPKAEIAPGTYRKITGNEAIAMGLVAAAQLAETPLVYASYPITPASDILHELAEMKRFGVRTHPGRRRNRRHRRGHRRSVRRCHRRHRHERAGHLPEVRSHRPRRHDRTAARHHRRSARRAEHGLADQDRAGRPVAGDVRPQRRMPRRDRRAVLAGRLLRHDRSRPSASRSSS